MPGLNAGMWSTSQLSCPKAPNACKILPSVISGYQGCRSTLCWTGCTMRWVIWGVRRVDATLHLLCPSLHAISFVLPTWLQSMQSPLRLYPTTIPLHLTTITRHSHGWPSQPGVPAILSFDLVPRMVLRRTETTVHPLALVPFITLAQVNHNSAFLKVLSCSKLVLKKFRFKPNSRGATLEAVSCLFTMRDLLIYGEWQCSPLDHIFWSD